MTKEDFRLRLVTSLNKSIEIAEKFVKEDLQNKLIINLYSRDKKDRLIRISIDEVVEKLYRDGKTPKWVNLNVVKVDCGYTILECCYSDIFTNDDKLMQFHNEPQSPFKSGSPYLPPHWKGLENDGKFNLVKYDEEEGWPQKQ